jgi:hypothetical protein
MALPLALAAGAAAQSNPLVEAMSQELGRNFQALKEKADPPPYFLSYEITQEDAYTVSGTLGAIDTNGGGKSRRLDVSVRVGTPKLDNYHRVRGAGAAAGHALFRQHRGLAHRARARFRARRDHGFGQGRRWHRPEHFRDVRSRGCGRPPRR